MKKIKATILFVVGSIIMLSSCNSNKNLLETEREIKNLKAFAKAYGYVRWFHPSDEGAAIDWDSLAVAGIHCIKGAKNDQALIDSLRSIFSPIVTGLQITNEVDNSKEPQIEDGETEVYWYHVGVGNMARYASSQRTNRPDLALYKSGGILLGYYMLEKTDEEFQINLEMRGQLEDGSNLLIISAKSFPGVASQIYHLDTIKKIPPDWIEYNLSTNFQNKHKALRGLEIIALLVGNGEVEINAPSVRYASSGQSLKEDYSFFNEPLEKGSSLNEKSYDNGNIADYYFEGNWLRIKGKKLKPKYDIDQRPANAFFADEIVQGIYFSMPQILNLSRDYQPNLDKIELTRGFIKRNYQEENEYLASTLIMWNQIQHFFPYLRDLNVSWEKKLGMLIMETLKIKNDLDFYFFLYESTAELKDGHQSVFHESAQLKLPPFYINVFADEVIITSSNDTSKFVAGDKILSYDTVKGIDEYNYWYDFTGGSSSRKKYLAIERFGMRKDSTEVTVSLLRDQDTVQQKITISKLPYQKRRPFTYSRMEWMRDSILYIDASKWDGDFFDTAIEEINDSHGLLLDMRNGNRVNDSRLINHLFDSAFSYKSIKCFLPINTEPHQVNTTFLDLEIEYDVNPEKPTIDVPICVLTSGILLSWQETILYSLRTTLENITFVGKPTAGGDGMVNTLNLPGDYRYNYTQVYFLRTDSTKHHGIGFIPDIIIEPTKTDFINGNDPALETGIIELLK